MKKNKALLLLFFSVSILSIASYFPIFDFGFWKDDWIAFWVSKYGDPISGGNWLHPATNIQFWILSNYWQPSHINWQIFSFLLKVIAGVSVYYVVYKLSKSSQSGFIASLLYASTPLGLDAVGWSSASVVNLLVILASISSYLFLNYLTSKKRKDLILFILILGMLIVSDTWRGMPLVIFLYFLTYLVKNAKFVKKVRNAFHKIFIGLAFLLPIFLMIQNSIIGKSKLILFFEKNIIHPEIFISKAYVLGNYFSSIFYMFGGWIFYLPENLSTGVYSIYYSVFGFSILIITLIIGIYALVYKKKEFLIFALFLLWIFVFYIPNWLAEPRLTMGATHRYMVLSSVGMVGVIALIIDRIRRKKLKAAILILIIFMQIVASHFYLNNWKFFRDRDRVNAIWDKIIETAPPGREMVFVFPDPGLIRDNAVSLSGPAPYAALAGLINPQLFPFVIYDTQMIKSFICKANKRSLMGKDYNYDNITRNNIYVWDIDMSGLLIDSSSDIRESSYDSCDN